MDIVSITDNQNYSGYYPVKSNLTEYIETITQHTGTRSYTQTMDYTTTQTSRSSYASGQSTYITDYTTSAGTSIVVSVVPYKTTTLYSVSNFTTTTLSQSNSIAYKWVFGTTSFMTNHLFLSDSQSKEADADYKKVSISCRFTISTFEPDFVNENSEIKTTFLSSGNIAWKVYADNYYKAANDSYKTFDTGIVDKNPYISSASGVVTAPNDDGAEEWGTANCRLQVGIEGTYQAYFIGDGSFLITTSYLSTMTNSSAIITETQTYTYNYSYKTGSRAGLITTFSSTCKYWIYTSSIKLSAMHYSYKFHETKLANVIYETTTTTSESYKAYSSTRYVNPLELESVFFTD